VLLGDVQDRIARARHIRSIENDWKFADCVEEQERLLDRVFARTARAQKYAISLKGSAAESIATYQEVHAERVEAFLAAKIWPPSREALKLGKKDLRQGKNYWEEAGKKGRWYDFGLGKKFKEMEIGSKGSGQRREKGSEADGLDPYWIRLHPKGIGRR
jgi:hypothetical protein